MKLLSFLGKLQFNLQKVCTHQSPDLYLYLLLRLVQTLALSHETSFCTFVTVLLLLDLCSFSSRLVCKCLLEVLRAVHKGILGFWCKTTLSVIIEFAICIYCTGRVLFWSYIFVFNYIFYLIIYFFVLAICIFLDASCFDYIFLRLHHCSAAGQAVRLWCCGIGARVQNKVLFHQPLELPLHRPRPSRLLLQQLFSMHQHLHHPPLSVGCLVSDTFSHCWHWTYCAAVVFVVNYFVCVCPWALQSHNLLNNYHMMERSVPMSPVRPF